MADDTVDLTRWTLDPRARHALALEAAREALSEGDPTAALGIAEELLDSEPNEIGALIVVAQAAPRCGHAAVGILAAEQARRRGIDTGAIEAEALLAAGRVPEAMIVAESRLDRAPQDAHAHAVLGQALDLLGDRSRADHAYAHAARIDPESWPLPLGIGTEEWEALLLEVLSQLDHDERTAVRALDICFADLPELEDLRAAAAPYPAWPPGVDGLLLPGTAPPRLLFYRRNLCRSARTTADLVERMLLVMEAEIRALAEDQAPARPR